jgi:hypothetical protein
MLPEDTVHVRFRGALYKKGPVLFTANDTEVSSVLKPDPVTTTTVPVGPAPGVKLTIGPPVTVNGAEADGNPLTSLTVIQ